MIMPCIKATSAGERCGSVAWVEGGRVLLGFPGAPGCTTTGVFAESVCCACAEGKSAISGMQTDTSAQKIGAVAPADQIFRLRQHKKSFTALSPHPLRCTHAITKMQKEAWRGTTAGRKSLDRDVHVKTARCGKLHPNGPACSISCRRSLVSAGKPHSPVFLRVAPNRLVYRAKEYPSGLILRRVRRAGGQLRYGRPARLDATVSNESGSRPGYTGSVPRPRPTIDERFRRDQTAMPTQAPNGGRGFRRRAAVDGHPQVVPKLPQ